MAAAGGRGRAGPGRAHRRRADRQRRSRGGERVVTNLISNAIKYTPPGDTVEIGLVDEPTGLRLPVLDTGAGIGDDLQSRLFGRLESSRGDARRKTGTGIGLFVAKQLVDAHGGTIAALRREPGRAASCASCCRRRWWSRSRPGSGPCTTIRSSCG